MKIRVALEWFLNPDHLPFIVGLEKGWYKEAGLDVELIEPKEHYDGFKALETGDVEIVVNEPIHLFEHYFDELRSLGCFFETRGGVMVLKEHHDRLLSGEKIKVTTPAANDVTNRVGFEILDRYRKKEGFTKDLQVEFVETDFYHIKNLKSGNFEAAWLCFDNFEGVEAQVEGLDIVLIDQEKSDYPNFSALDIMTTDSVYSNNKQKMDKFIEISSKALEFIKNNQSEAKEIYYGYSNDERNQLMDNIVSKTIGYLENNIEVDENRWKNLCDFLNELNITNITQEEYDKIWLK
ncbi:MAG: ABC transporter substrate-binding protein [Campylobacterales bacterium]|nr:ABC transporter substrate-binding protein [Campylobacterales bacterium]